MAEDYASTWVLHLQPDGAILVDRGSLYYVRLSATAAELLLQFSRAGTLDRVVEARAVIDNLDPAEVRQLLDRLLSPHPLTAEWLHGGIDSPIPVTGSTTSFLPIALTLQLTNGCNLTCPFCYASSGTQRSDELSAAEWVQILHNMAPRGVLSVTLSGGEPTMAPAFREVLTAASGLVSSVAVFSNGYSWSKSQMRLVAALGNVAVQISLDGKAETHDAIRGGHRSFDRALATIQALTDVGVAVDVAMTATPRNATEVYAVARAVAAAGARLLRVGQVQTVGRGTGGAFGLDPDSADTINTQLERFATEGHDLEVFPWSGCDGPEALLAGTGFQTEFLVPGYLAWYVLSDGRVTPCQLEESSVMGDIRQDSADDLGHPARLHRVSQGAVGCTCMRHVQRGSEPDLPYTTSVTSGPGS